MISAITLSAVILTSTTVFATDRDEAVLISQEQVTLTSTDTVTRGIENKEFTLSTYDNNGVTVYGFDIDDPEYRQAGIEYIKRLTGDPGYRIQTRGFLSPGESEYHNDEGRDGTTYAYAWKQNTASTYTNNF